MKRLSMTALVLAAVLAVVPLAFAAAPYTSSKPAAKPAVKPAATVQVEGTVLALGKGWVRVEVTKVLKGAGLRVKEKIRFREASRLTIRQNGKPVSLTVLKTGETVEITARVLHAGKVTAYTATSITIMQ